MTQLKKLIKKYFRIETEWSIGIYMGESPFSLATPKGLRNPVLSYQDVTDISASFVADPFMIRDRDTWFMFFEALNISNQRGEIGLATSKNGLSWIYQQIILNEPFHLSYPYVFKWNDEYYMIPESAQVKAVRLYKATDFPTQWTYVDTLIDGCNFVDSTVFQWYDKWWLLASNSEGSDNLYLYYAEEPTGPWVEHLKSPVVQGNKSIARPAGRVVMFDGRLIRFTQDCQQFYGKQVRAFEITELTSSSYEEKEVSKKPILKASGTGWNKDGMHHIDSHQLNGKWIACVDGKNYKISFYT